MLAGLVLVAVQIRQSKVVRKEGGRVLPSRTGDILGLVLLAALAGCGGSEHPESTDLTTLVDSSGAYPVVRNSGQAPVWSVEHLGTVGRAATLGSPAPDEFGRISSVTMGPDERVWIADQFQDRIKVFGPDGSLALEVGREGQGPGEFGALYSLAWVGETLLALDLGNGRIAELSAEGDWLGTRRAPGRISGSPAMLRFYPVSDSTVVQWSLGSGGGWIWVEQGPEGVVREWPQVAVEPPETTLLRCNRPDGVTSFFSIPFAGRQLNHPTSSGRSYLAWSFDYRIALVGPTGDTLRVIERDWPEVAVSDEEWDEATAEFREFQEEWPGADCTPRGMERPQRKAALENLLLDTEGRVWVEAVSEDGRVWEIFDAEGGLLGSVPGFTYQERVAPSIRRGHIAWSSRDSLEVEYVHWARVPELSSF